MVELGFIRLGCQSLGASVYYLPFLPIKEKSPNLICLEGASLRVSCIQVTNRAFVKGIKINVTNLFKVVVYCYNHVLPDNKQSHIIDH